MRPPEFEDWTLDETDTLVTGNEPVVKQFFYLLSLYQCKNTTVNKYHLQVWKEGKVMPVERVGKTLHDHQTAVKVKGYNQCYFWSIVYLLTGS